MTSMRERSRSRGRRKKASTSRSDPAGLPQLEHAPEDVLPLEDLAYDPDTMGLPPAAHGESPAPEAATAPSTDAVPSAEESGSESTGADAGQEAAAPERLGRDVPLEFDDEREDFDEEDLQGPDQDPQEATLADLFGPEDDDTEDEADAEGGDAPVQGGQDDVQTGAASEEDVRIELGDVALEEDAVELGGDLEILTDASGADTPAEDEDATQGAVASAAGTDDQGPADAPETSTQNGPGKPEARSPRRKDGRPGVPSWDDIMFGAKGRRG